MTRKRSRDAEYLRFAVSATAVVQLGYVGLLFALFYVHFNTTQTDTILVCTVTITAIMLMVALEYTEALLERYEALPLPARVTNQEEGKAP